MTTGDRATAEDGSGGRPAAFSIVCLSSQEWDAPLPTNRQQIMRRAAERGHTVLFVETGDFVGKHLANLVRGPRRRSLARRLTTGERVLPGLTVRKSLNLLPWGQRYRLSDRVNGLVGALVVRRAASRLPLPRIAWLYDPRATWAIGAVGDAFGVYDCVDDYAEQVAGDRNRALVAAADRRAATESRLVFTTTRALRERHARVNARTELVRNVGDFAHFSPAAERDLARGDLAALPRPVLGFAGNILSRKLDVELLASIADRDPERSVLVAGPADDGLRPAMERLAARPNVTWLGPVPYGELPAVIAAFDVGLIPYATNDYTRNVFPLKLFEYLAAGKPVVATGLPELVDFEPDVVVGTGIEDAEQGIAAALALRGPDDVARRQAIAAENTWETRTERLLSLVAGELAAT
jgi:glycosyltransferase involved in cell wall biosynthesis